MTDDARLPDARTLVERMSAGDAVVVRARDASVREQRALALLGSCRSQGVLLLVSDDTELAREIGADGVHLPEAALRASPHRPEGPPGWFVTASAHSAEALARAQGAGVDAAILSPVFATFSHPDARPLGLERFAELARWAGLPVYAMGGVTEAEADVLEAAGAAGIAGIGFAL